jgi:hypothetical protein
MATFCPQKPMLAGSGQPGLNLLKFVKSINFIYPILGKPPALPGWQ